MAGVFAGPVDLEALAESVESGAVVLNFDGCSAGCLLLIVFAKAGRAAALVVVSFAGGCCYYDGYWRLPSLPKNIGIVAIVPSQTAAPSQSMEYSVRLALALPYLERLPLSIDRDWVLLDPVVLGRIAVVLVVVDRTLAGCAIQEALAPFGPVASFAVRTNAAGVPSRKVSSGSCFHWTFALALVVEPFGILLQSLDVVA